MTLPKLPEPEPIQLLAYRNIHTIKTSQDLYDDLVDDTRDFKTLQTWDNATSQIDHSLPLIQRNFQYGNQSETVSVFDQLSWQPGRFSDGTFGVWYGAKDRETSIYETLYWSYKHAKEDIAISKRPVVKDRKMFEANCSAERAIDLAKALEIESNLVSDDYRLCQSLGSYAARNEIGLYLTPSARKAGGVCVPVFQPKVISSDRMLYFCHFTFFPDGKAQITTDQDHLIEIPASWR